MTDSNFSIKKLTIAGVCIAIGLFLPFLTGQIPQIGSALLPMHLPVLICGFVCGGPIGLIVGAITPLLRSAIFTMPPMGPGAVAMAFEMATYGFLTGVLYRKLGKSIKGIYISLIAAMLGGRIVWGIARAIMSGVGGFTWAMFIAGGFTKAIPGIIVQLILVPLIINALQKSKLI